MTRWTLSREYSLDSFNLMCVTAVLLLFCFLPNRKKKHVFVIVGLLNVKTVDERCIRSVCCTMTSFGRQGEYSLTATLDKYIQAHIRNV